jgi:SOS-response transcriptional repressor LexA
MNDLDYNPEANDYKGVSVHAGFPNAQDDSRLQALDLNTLLVTHPNSTFHFRIAGRQWQAIGVFDGDLALVDRALDPQANDLVVWWHNDIFAVSHYHRLPKGAAMWGVITVTIHQFRSTHYEPAN